MTILKVVLLGEPGAGKSSLVSRVVNNRFDECQEPTIGAAFFTKVVPHPVTGSAVRIEIWDTAGQERYRSLVPMYTRNAHVLWVLAPAGSHPSVFDAWDKYVTGCEGALRVPIFSKADLVDDAVTGGGGPFLTSARTGFGIQQLLEHTVVEGARRVPPPPPPALAAGAPPRSRPRCCPG